MVRRSAAQKLGAFAKSVEKDYVGRELMGLFTDLTQDGEACLLAWEKNGPFLILSTSNLQIKTQCASWQWRAVVLLLRRWAGMTL
jgi:hypothetical protein